MIYAVGDIHGEIGPLKRMMLKMVDAGLTPEDNLIFLGDVIDRGAHSLEVVDYLIELQARYPSMRVLNGDPEIGVDHGVVRRRCRGGGGHSAP